MKKKYQQKTIQYILKQVTIKKICAFLVFGIIVSSISYGYLINKTVISVVDRKESGEKISELDTELSGYEFEYISKTSHITIDDALAMGYVEELSPLYVYAQGGTRLTYAQ